jgi:hypothetical protein
VKLLAPSFWLKLKKNSAVGSLFTTICAARWWPDIGKFLNFGNRTLAFNLALATGFAK